MITHLLNILIPFHDYSYIIFFLVLLACGFGVPIPEDITLVIGGITTAYHITGFWTTVIVCMFGVLIGDSAMYFMGRYLGQKALKSKFMSKIIKVKYIALVRLNSTKYGNYLTFFARFMPGVRSPVFFGMGMFKKRFLSFFLVDGFAAIISVPLWIYVGYFFGENIPVLEANIKKMEHGMYLIIFIIILIIVAVHYIKKKIIASLLKENNNKT